MILGIGTDLVHIPRIEKIILKYDRVFLDKTFTESEQNEAAQIHNLKIKYSFFAKRFAAKEALSKAVGCGFNKDLTFLDIIVQKNQEGQPHIILSNQAYNRVAHKFLQHFSENSKIKIDLSLTDEYPMAQAFVILSLISDNPN